MLGDNKDIILPPAPNENSKHFDTFQNYEIQLEKRNELKNFLKANGVGTIIQWGY